MRILVTGGAGFIGSNFIVYMLNKHADCKIFNVDLLTYSGNLNNLIKVENNPNYKFIKADIANRTEVNQIFKLGIDAVVNFAAESHVDRSIMAPDIFVKTNVLGTQVLLEEARLNKVSKFVQISTDEVYGSLGEEGFFNEETPLLPNSPYSASKAGGDFLVRAYYETYGLPTVITRCSNNYGPFQFPEKLIPLIIVNALSEKAIPIYGDGLYIRDWLYVEDHCSAIDLVLNRGVNGEVYNIGGNNERTNLQLAKTVLRELSKPETMIQFVQDRPGHDRRYGIDSKKIRSQLGWNPMYDFETGIRNTIHWYLQNQDWWKDIEAGEYRNYYLKQYGTRMSVNQ
ncbi:dTDP-glucose 4,6-dehydratase [Paenibacillus ginsengarvi]|uniref:dTDP-glucose 4,6-dehydratase n=1 Tax=Paenibacillus ginsengarvi TaxID=400777 RepID=A0A3B0CCA9_9BACL|nr:dTDP-glucose 4,6-dehydratase [Paenibacillus ginsengarvi]RKN82178.1 dTDP-glucose 4,6-dehydratase [Paenibacillus ginsengarvi]